MKKIRVGIIGSAGYTGGELLRILIYHPEVEIVFAHSVSNAGNKLYHVHNDLIGDTELVFSSDYHSAIDVLFLCVGHGDAHRFLESNRFAPTVKIIDLSQDFRLKSSSVYNGNSFIYGLPELNRDAIRSAQYIANPGCFATNMQLALLPIAYAKLLPNQIHIHATTGSTGAGQKPTHTTHFSWRSNNLSVYNAFTHRHLQEVSESLNQLQSNFLSDDNIPLLEKASKKINFIPQRGDFTRGIFSSTYLECNLTIDEAYKLYRSYYASHPFIVLSEDNIDLKQVINTNKSLIHLEKHGDKLVVLNATDNLVKGASGQAIQNMNLMFGIDERTGLNLKSLGY